MKKFVATLLILMLFAGSAQAAQWPQGRGPGKPYEGTVEVNLNKTMGYVLLYPRAGIIPAENFCDTLTIYLPREDIKLASGKARLYSGQKEVASFDFADPEHVQLRKLTETELDQLLWGSGVCIEMFLDVSLTVGESYYVLMDEGCFTTQDGAIKSLSITNPEAWQVAVNGDFGVSGLSYKAAAGGGAYRLHPEAGDVISFQLLLGGDVKNAAIYSDNDSVAFEERVFEQSGPVTGVVTLNDLHWGVVFLNEKGEPLGVVRLVD